MYKKRQNISRTWPLPSKGNKYVVVPSQEHKHGIPIVIILRDILGLAENRKEARKILNSGKIKVNNKNIKEDNFSILPFDIIEIGNERYLASFSEKRKFQLEETKQKEKISKIINKKILKENKVQINLLYGGNLIIDKKTKAKVGDSVIIKDKKIKEIIPVEKSRQAIIIAGKNMGKKGKIVSIEDNIVIISTKDKKIKTKIKDFVVLK
jgi:small subunit ribosomal protein S4e